MIGLLLVGCATPMVLPTHHAVDLLKSTLDGAPPPSFAGRTVLLSFEGDKSVVPVGALLDDYHRGITPAIQTYVMPQPGLVLFESLAASLEDAGARVYRAYPDPIYQPDAIADAVRVGFSVTSLEVHRWRTRDGDFLLLGADVVWNMGSHRQSDRVMTRVPVDRDVFLAAGDELSAALYARLP